MEHQYLFELVARVNLCNPTSTSLDAGIIDRELPIGKFVDGRIMHGSKQLDHNVSADAKLNKK